MAIWFEDPSVLYKKSMDFIPMESHNIDERLNSIVRFSVLAGILLSISRDNIYFLIIPILLTLGGTFIYKFIVGDAPEIERKNAEKFADCVRPTKDNPFMNALILDDKERQEACKINDPTISQEASDMFSVNNFRNVDDVYGINGGSPQRFYTNPVTTVDQREYEMYKKFLFNNKERGNTMYSPSCKEEPTACRVQYEDVRFKNRN